MAKAAFQLDLQKTRSDVSEPTKMKLTLEDLSLPKWMNFWIFLKRGVVGWVVGGHFRSKKFHCKFGAGRNGSFDKEHPEKNAI